MDPEYAWRLLVLQVIMGGAFAGLLCVLWERAWPGIKRWMSGR